MDVIIKSLHFAGQASGFTLALVPFIKYFKDCTRLYAALLLTISPADELGLFRYLPPTLALLTFADFRFGVFLTWTKWKMYPMQLIPALFASSIWISQSESPHLYPEERVELYRGVYIFMGILNQVFSGPLISYKCLIVMGISLGFTACLLQGLTLVSVPICILSVSFLFVSNFVLSIAQSIFTDSRALIHGIKFGSNTKRVRRTANSLRECRIKCGSLYFIDKGVLAKANARILETIVKNVLMFKKIR